MDSPKDVFEVCGPKHLSFVDWTCPHHRRSVAASLVQGVYVSERDRQREHNLALGPPWWQFFQFSLIRTLIDDTDFSVFGAIYQYMPNQSTNNPSAGSAPRYVVAFRGTITKGSAHSRDIELDVHFVRNILHKTSRSEIAIQAVRNLVSTTGTSNIWLAGHSLGSAIANLVGKNMAKTTILLETFLFNPPFVSAPIERIKDKTVRQGIRIASSFITAGLTVALKARRQLPHCNESFTALASWVPNLFVNPEDHLCSEYIGYFEHRQKMEEIGAGNIERLATQNSISDLFLGAFGKESESLHLLPSARLTINRSHSPDFKWAHGIHQWWRPDLNLQCLHYHYH